MVRLKFLKDPSGYCIDQRKAKVQAGRPGRRGRGQAGGEKEVKERLLDY